MKHIKIRFATAKEFLDAYWGLLANGGVSVRDDHGLREGESVTLDITLESTGTHQRLRGQVARCTLQDDKPVEAVVAFYPGEPHEVLLSAAWAELESRPPRRHARLPVDSTVSIRLLNGSAETTGRLMDVSASGMCIRTEEAEEELPLSGGEKVMVVTELGTAHGVVRWRKPAELGVEFDGTPFPEGLVFPSSNS
ncbi:MAG: PilZ domain-containing protein [Myxococcota bacterium]